MKKAMITLTALVSVILAIFVILTIFFAQNKYLSVQNIEELKIAKEYSLVLESLQILSFDSSINVGTLNSSLEITQNEVKIGPDGKITSGFDIFKQGFLVSCNLELNRREGVDGEMIDNYLDVNLLLDDNRISCENKNEN